jgi:hypothetical protein
MATKKKNQESEKPKVQPLTIQNAKLMYRNFSGAAKKFNAKGLRNFHILLEPDIAKTLEKDGWNIKWDDPKEEDDPPVAHIKVAVRFDNYPPRILLITSKNRSVLSESTVDILDWAEIETADVVLTGSPWDVQGKQGIKAYLKKGFFTLSDDDLETKYAMPNNGPSEEDA